MHSNSSLSLARYAKNVFETFEFFRYMVKQENVLPSDVEYMCMVNYLLEVCEEGKEFVEQVVEKIGGVEGYEGVESLEEVRKCKELFGQSSFSMSPPLTPPPTPHTPLSSWPTSPLPQLNNKTIFTFNFNFIRFFSIFLIHIPPQLNPPNLNPISSLTTSQDIPPRKPPTRSPLPPSTSQPPPPTPPQTIPTQT